MLSHDERTCEEVLTCVHVTRHSFAQCLDLDKKSVNSCAGGLV
jgi:hypothetical protein